LRNATADGVRHLLVADFRNHSSAVDLLLDHFRAPDPAADRTTRALDLSRAAAARIAGIRNALLADRTRNVSGYGLPFATTNIDTTCFRDRLAHCVADVFPAGLGFCLPGGVALVAVAGLVAGLADVVTHRAIAGLVAGLADVVADVFVARLVARLANVAGHRAVARFHHRFADLLLDTTVFGFVHRLAHGVTFVAVAGLVDVANALNRNRLRALIVHRFHAGVLLLFHDNFGHGPKLWTAATFCSGKITAVVAGLGGAACKTASSAQAGHQQTAVQQYGNCSSGSNHEPCHRLIPHCLVSNRIGGSLAKTSSST
jgi:hypothetical protein